jgi:hypothetical protein
MRNPQQPLPFPIHHSPRSRPRRVACRRESRPRPSKSGQSSTATSHFAPWAPCDGQMNQRPRQTFCTSVKMVRNHHTSRKTSRKRLEGTKPQHLRSGLVAPTGDAARVQREPLLLVQRWKRTTSLQATGLQAPRKAAVCATALLSATSSDTIPLLIRRTWHEHLNEEARRTRSRGTCPCRLAKCSPATSAL